MKTYIIGLGTGRCGTMSLSKLLNDCKGINISHEFRNRGDSQYRLKFYFNKQEADRRIKHLKNLKEEFVGDIAHYYLNYIDYFMENLPNLKLIYLDRDINETVKSFMKKTKKVGNRCHWLPINHPDMIKNKYTHEPWSRTFPKFPQAKNKEEAFKIYCKGYFEVVLNLSKKYSIWYLNVKDLNLKSKQKGLFNWLKIPEKNRVYQNVWENKS